MTDAGDVIETAIKESVAAWPGRFDPGPLAERFGRHVAFLVLEKLGVDPDAPGEPQYETHLRDMFAMMALPAVFADWSNGPSGRPPATIATTAWRLADLMMDAREGRAPDGIAADA